MRKTLKHLVVGSLLIFSTTACADLEVLNQNEPDAARSLATAGDVLSLIGGSYNSWFYGNYSYYSAGMALSNAAFQHNAPWANAGMEKYGRIPRIAFINSIADGDYNYMTRSWFYSYRAIAAVADGLKSLDREEISSGLTADEAGSSKAFAKFVQGMAHATVATLFSEGFVVDETTDITAPQDPLGYAELMDKALAYFDECISLSQGASWTLPLEWMRAPLSGPELARVAHSMKARYRAANARTPAERAAVNWQAVIQDIDAGITSTFIANYDDYNGWSQDVWGYVTYPYWSQLAYFIYGMADQSGNYQLWNSTALTAKSYKIGDQDILILTPDQRFPQGSTVDAQRLAPGTHVRINRAEAAETGYTWARPDRGVWRWSWYKHNRGEEYWNDLMFDLPEIRIEEMNLLKAEGLFRTGDKAGAAALVNLTRTAAGLSATDGSDTNTSCVPKLPDESCGGFMEMLKWEKRLETVATGPLGVGWYFDARGWGDLFYNTFVHLPIPCQEAQVLQLLPCQSFGGPGGEGAAPISTYKWNGEG